MKRRFLCAVYVGRAKMRYKITKIGSILCAASFLVSLSGCLFFPGYKKYTYNQVSEELRKTITVTDWDGPVPDGMEVRYVMTRKVWKDDEGNSSDLRYEYDEKGRQTAEISVEDNHSTRASLVYNDDGTLARKEYKTTGKIYGYHIQDFEVTYEYNDNAQLVSYKRVSFSDEGEESRKEITQYEYENGHLVSDGNRTYDYNDDAAPFYEYVVNVSDSHSSADVSIKKCFYDENRVLISEKNESSETIVNYEYENGVLTGSTATDKWGYCTHYDADGNRLYETDSDGNYIFRYTYNEHGDQLSYEEWKDGKPRSKNTSSYVYDENGNRVSLEKEFWSVDSDGKERSFKSKDTYEYDEHGLLISEVSEIDGRFNRMEVYSYEAILVPVE